MQKNDSTESKTDFDIFTVRVFWNETNSDDLNMSIDLFDNVSYAKSECISNRHFLMKERLKLSIVNFRCWKLIIKKICDNVIYKVIYIKSICRLNEKLIVEKQIRNEQHFYKFERCSVDTLSINFCFFVSISVVTYNFYS